MVSNGKHGNTIAARYERLRIKAEAEARQAGQWQRRKGAKVIQQINRRTIAQRYAQLKAKADQEGLDARGLEWVLALLTPTGKRRRLRTLRSDY